MRFKAIAGFVGIALMSSLAFASGASAAPFDSGAGYPRFAHEGKYPEATGCSFSLQQSRTGSYGGRTITLKYFYSNGCGSFARIENAPRACSAWLDRTPTRNTSNWDYVGETVDSGINYAYTKVGNNLSGRYSRAALVCNGGVIARTSWY